MTDGAEPDSSTVVYRSTGGPTSSGAYRQKAHADPHCHSFTRTPDRWIKEVQIGELENPEFCGTCCPEEWDRQFGELADVGELLEAVDRGELEAEDALDQLAGEN